MKTLQIVHMRLGRRFFTVWVGGSCGVHTHRADDAWVARFGDRPWCRVYDFMRVYP